MAHGLLTFNAAKYAIVFIVALLLCLCLFPRPSMPGLEKRSLILRHMHPADIDQVTTVAIAAFPYDPQWDYRYPHRKEFPEAHYKYVRLGFEEYMVRTQAGLNEMLVAVNASVGQESDGDTIVAFAVYDVVGSGRGKATPPVKNYFERRDGDAARMKAYSKSTMAARQDIFYHRYGEQQKSLRQMATHPDHWKQGAATMLLKWGLREAEEQNVPITMFASPMGKQLYQHYGFKELARAYVNVEGEKEFLNVSCMAWEPEKLANSLEPVPAGAQQHIMA